MIEENRELERVQTDLLGSSSSTTPTTKNREKRFVQLDSLISFDSNAIIHLDPSTTIPTTKTTHPNQDQDEDQESNHRSKNIKRFNHPSSSHQDSPQHHHPIYPAKKIKTSPSSPTTTTTILDSDPTINPSSDPISTLKLTLDSSPSNSTSLHSLHHHDHPLLQPPSTTLPTLTHPTRLLFDHYSNRPLDLPSPPSSPHPSQFLYTLENRSIDPPTSPIPHSITSTHSCTPLSRPSRSSSEPIPSIRPWNPSFKSIRMTSSLPNLSQHSILMATIDSVDHRQSFWANPSDLQSTHLTPLDLNKLNPPSPPSSHQLSSRPVQPPGSASTSPFRPSHSNPEKSFSSVLSSPPSSLHQSIDRSKAVSLQSSHHQISRSPTSPKLDFNSPSVKSPSRLSQILTSTTRSKNKLNLTDQPLLLDPQPRTSSLNACEPARLTHLTKRLQALRASSAMIKLSSSPSSISSTTTPSIPPTRKTSPSSSSSPPSPPPDPTPRPAFESSSEHRPRARRQASNEAITANSKRGLERTIVAQDHPTPHRRVESEQVKLSKLTERRTKINQKRFSIIKVEEVFMGRPRPPSPEGRFRKGLGTLHQRAAERKNRNYGAVTIPDQALENYYCPARPSMVENDLIEEIRVKLTHDTSQVERELDSRSSEPLANRSIDQTIVTTTDPHDSPVRCRCRAMMGPSQDLHRVDVQKPNQGQRKSVKWNEIYLAVDLEESFHRFHRRRRSQVSDRLHHSILPLFDRASRKQADRLDTNPSSCPKPILKRNFRRISCEPDDDNRPDRESGNEEDGEKTGGLTKEEKNSNQVGRRPADEEEEKDRVQRDENNQKPKGRRKILYSLDRFGNLIVNRHGLKKPTSSALSSSSSNSDSIPIGSGGCDCECSDCRTIDGAPDHYDHPAPPSSLDDPIAALEPEFIKVSRRIWS